MPYMSNGRRDYKKEGAWDRAHKDKNGVSRKKARAMRNKARAIVAKKQGVKATSLKGDVGHKKAISKGGKSTLANLFVQSPASNRSFSRHKDGSMKNERSSRER